jgi:NAD(P)-dependent dehydrogenase (short-subunit alcohol dehydrogenase family)
MRGVVVVSGGTAGVGRAAAIAFARKGYAVAVLARGANGLAETQAGLEHLGRAPMLALAVDVADADAVEAAAAEVEQSLGPIDIWVNEAMATVFSPVSEMTAEEYRRVTEVTYLGTVHGTLSALRRMRARDRGAIVQVGSALSYRAIPLQSAYCAAKFAIRGFTDSLRTELIHDRSRIHVTMVQLPAVNTPQFDWARNKLPFRPQPLPPIFAPEIPAEAIVFAAEHRRREIFVGWPSIKAILGNKLIPGIGDRVVAHEGYRGQESAEPATPGRADNLFEPVAGFHDLRGRFTSQEVKTSPALWLSLHGRTLAATALGAAAGVALVLMTSAGRSHRVRAA